MPDPHNQNAAPQDDAATDATPGPTADGIAKLRDPELRPLLELLLRKPAITSIEMADALGIDGARLRSWRSRRPLLRDIVVLAGRTRSTRGRPHDRLRLNPAWRAEVQKVFVPVDTRPKGQVLLHVPQLDAVSDLITRANEERVSRVRAAYELQRHAKALMDETVEKIEFRARAGVFHVDGRAREQIDEVRLKLNFLTDTILLDSRDKLRQVNDRAADLATASRSEADMERYFANVPLRSLSGYGGAICARTHERCQRPELDEFLARRATGVSTRPKFIPSIHHALEEALSLAQYDEGWAGTARRMLSVIRDSPPLATLRDIRQLLARSQEGVLAEDVRSFVRTHAPGSGPDDHRLEGAGAMADALEAM